MLVYDPEKRTKMYSDIYEPAGERGEKTLCNEWKKISEQDVVSEGKERDDWFQKLIALSATTTTSKEPVGMTTDDDVGASEARWSVIDTITVNQFLFLVRCLKKFASNYFGDKNLFIGLRNQQRYCPDNKWPQAYDTARELIDNISSILAIFEGNNCFGVNVGDSVGDQMNFRGNETGGDATIDFKPGSFDFAFPATAISQVTGIRMTEDGSDEIDEQWKDVEFSELVGQLKLARRTISRQRTIIHDLERKIVGIAENFTGENHVRAATPSRPTPLDAMKLIQSEICKLKENENLMKELKAKEMRLSFEIEDARKQKNTLEDSIDILRGVIDQLQVNNLLFESQIGNASDTDVIILHDALLTHIKTDLFAKQQLIMENILCPRLSDALQQLRTSKERPEVVIVHTGAEDLASLQVEEMCEIVTNIHAFVTNNGMKLIMCNITPSFEHAQLASKARRFNSNIYSRLGAYDNVTICKSNDLNDNAGQSEEGGISGQYKRSKNLTKLRQNKRFSLCPYQGRGKENYNGNERLGNIKFY